MKDYCLVVGSSANLPTSYYENRDILCFDVPYTLDEETHGCENPLSSSDFYAGLRSGLTSYTPAPSLERAEEFLRQTITTRDCDIIFITISSKLGYINDVMHLASSNVMHDFPHHRITIIDSQCAAMGEGILVTLASHFKQKGFSYDENIIWLNRLRKNIIHFFFTDDLNSLQRNHKISRFAAVLGTLLDIKVLFHLDNSGAITLHKLASSRRHAMQAIVDDMAKRLEPNNFKKRNKTIYICHGDCEKDAITLSQMIRKEYGYTDFIIEPLSPIIGGYTGPGTLAVFYLGEYR